MIPKYITIGSYSIPVNKSEGLVDTLGEYHSDPPLILIDPYQPKHLATATVLHEALHAISDKSNLHLEEEQVQGLEVALVDFIRQNRPLVRAIMEAR